MSQKDLARQIRLSPAALSQIVTGKAKPRQVNLTRIMKAICQSEEDEQRIIHAFYNVEQILPDSPSELERPIEEDNVQRVKQYLKLKKESIRLKQEVEAELMKAGVRYFKDYIQKDIVCDFYLPDQKIVLECKANPRRDRDRLEVTTSLIQGLLDATVLVVVQNEYEHHNQGNFVKINKLPRSLENI